MTNSHQCILALTLLFFVCLGAANLVPNQMSGNSAMTADDLLFGSPIQDRAVEPANNLELLNQILGTDPVAGGQNSTEPDNSFSKQWREMFGNEMTPGSNLKDPNEQSGFMPSDLLDSMAKFDPFGSSGAVGATGNTAAPRGPLLKGAGLNSSGKGSPMSSFLSSSKQMAPVSETGKEKEKGKKAADLSSWFNLFSDLDPLANPDAVDKKNCKTEEERQC